jgi:hypothetical protein
LPNQKEDHPGIDYPAAAYKWISGPNLNHQVIVRSAMPNGSKRGLALALLLILCTPLPVHGQMGGGHSGRQKSQQQTSKTSPAPKPPEDPPVTSSSQLLSGAILCKSDDDLVKYQAAVADRAASPIGLTPGCRAIQKTTEIEILDHDGSSRTQVETTDDAQEKGWTNSYIPSSSVAAGGKLH